LHSGSCRNDSYVKPLRIAGLFLVNLLVAVYGTALMETGIGPEIFHPKTLRSSLLAEEFISSIVAFALGYFGYRFLKSSAAEWVWVAGLCWFGQRALGLWLDQGVVRTLNGNHGIAIWGLPWSDPKPDPLSLSIWIGYTLPFLRTVLYSAGAFCWARLGAAKLPAPFSKSP
jgi:hypothetical protein